VSDKKLVGHKQPEEPAVHDGHLVPGAPISERGSLVNGEASPSSIVAVSGGDLLAHSFCACSFNQWPAWGSFERRSGACSPAMSLFDFTVHDSVW
jgi:hypothetical protein